MYKSTIPYIVLILSLFMCTCSDVFPAAFLDDLCLEVV